MSLYMRIDRLLKKKPGQQMSQCVCVRVCEHTYACASVCMCEYVFVSVYMREGGAFVRVCTFIQAVNW